jgi:hypothetical protein
MFIALGDFFQGAIAALIEGRGEGKILSDTGSLGVHLFCILLENGF